MRARARTAIGVGVVLALACSASGAQTAPRAQAIDPELLSARELAWRAFFAGDEKALGGLLPPEFIGLGWDDGPFEGQATTLAGSRAFREGGGKLVRLSFPETRAQAYGDVVILYGRYEVAFQAGGEETTRRGRLTEIFVRRNGRWIHPGWHLDKEGS